MAVKEVKEGSSKVSTSLLHTIAELLEVGMTFKSCSKSLKAFKDFAGLVLAKLDMFKITSTWVKRSFVLDFRSMIHVRILHLPHPFFSFSFSFLNTCLTLSYF